MKIFQFIKKNENYNKTIKFLRTENKKKIGATLTIRIRTEWTACHVCNFVIDNFNTIFVFFFNIVFQYKYGTKNGNFKVTIFFVVVVVVVNYCMLMKFLSKKKVQVQYYHSVVITRAYLRNARVYRLRCTAYDCGQEKGQKEERERGQETNTFICL